MRHTSSRRARSRIAGGGLFLWGALAAAWTGCVTPAGQQARPTIEVLRPHAEPELVTDASSPGNGARASASNARSGDARAPVRHKVEPGQTLYRIARTYEVTVEALMQANGIDDPRTLAVGQELVIPGAAAPRPIVPPGAQEAPEALAAEKAAQGEKPAPARTASSKPPPRKRAQAVVLPTQAGVLDWPLRGVLYARFGKKGRERHDGIDLAAPLGTPVRTAKAGTVLYAGEQRGYGLIAIIDHGDDLITLYAHNNDLRVRTGQKVRDGQVIATVGESGRTSGPHLHFEVRKGGVPVDPLPYLGAPPDRRTLGRRPRDDR